MDVGNGENHLNCKSEPTIYICGQSLVDHVYECSLQVQNLLLLCDLWQYKHNRFRQAIVKYGTDILKCFSGVHAQNFCLLLFFPLYYVVSNYIIIMCGLGSCSVQQMFMFLQRVQNMHYVQCSLETKEGLRTSFIS